MLHLMCLILIHQIHRLKFQFDICVLRDLRNPY